MGQLSPCSTPTSWTNIYKLKLSQTQQNTLKKEMGRQFYSATHFAFILLN